MTRILAVALAAFMLSPAAARADDAAECDAGIAMISAEIAKKHPQKTADSLATALRVAKREQGEKEYDECLDAVADAKKALGR
ncbi:histidine kinase [Hansschlegelia sp. KR7-227]|uniref:histidine kinase n=1 Tax=Hansschlegelia sp. KR7-227 TaxID=3400914 RepID=UPI003C073146